MIQQNIFSQSGTVLKPINSKKLKEEKYSKKLEAQKRKEEKEALKKEKAEKEYKRINEQSLSKKSEIFMTIEKKISLKPHGIVNHTSFKKEKYSQSESSRANIVPNAGEFNGYMSDATSRYVKRITENWLTAIELNTKNDFEKKQVGRDDVFVTFVTLTLPCKQVHHDNKIKNECLDPFIEWLRATDEKKGWNVKGYLWRAESQKNGDIHFHVIVDRWINHDALRRKWNQIINRLGYVDMYRMTQEYIYEDGFILRGEQSEKQVENMMFTIQQTIKDKKQIPSTRYVDNPEVRNTLNQIIIQGEGLTKEIALMLVEKIQRKAYEKGVSENWTNPNTTDIHKLNNINSISAYITKYVSKSDVKKPKLAKNQRVIKQGTRGVPYIYTLREGGDWENIHDWLDETPYKPEFESRKVHGRIWGKARSLSDGKEGKLIEPAQFTTEIKVLYDTEDKGRFQTTITRFEPVTDYVEAVKKQVPKAEIERLAKVIDSEYCEVIPLGKYVKRVNHKSKKSEKYFKTVKQVDFLEKLSPLVKVEYLKHYKNIFDNLYRKAG